jgi:hypothetical protein
MRCPVCGKQHHAKCHECPHEAEVRAGKWANCQFSKTPCFGCMDSDPDNRARHAAHPVYHADDLVSLDAMGDAAALAELADDASALARFRADLSSALGALMELDCRTRDIVILRLLGRTWSQVARQVNATYGIQITYQAAHAWLARAIQGDSTLLALFRVMDTRPPGKGVGS